MMTRTAHHPHATTAFPVYCLEWADDATLVLGGGGGPSRSGIDNQLVSPDGRKVSYIDELLLSREEDAPMTLAVDRETQTIVTGINAARAALEKGENAHVRSYTYADSKLGFKQCVQTIDAAWKGDFDDYPYQKHTAIAPAMPLVAVGTTDNSVALVRTPALEVAVPAFSTGDELVDLSWGGPDGDWLAVATTKSVKVYKVTLGEKVDINLVHSVAPPELTTAPVAFRSARGAEPAVLAVLNVAKPPRRKGAPNKAYVCRFRLQPAAEGDEKHGARWVVVAKREAGSKPITAMDVSADGRLVSYGCSDLSLGILDAKTLAPLLKILAAHSFPPTALKFNPSASLLVSASADNTIRVVVVPSSFAGWSGTLIAVLLALLAILLAVMLRR